MALFDFAPYLSSVLSVPAKNISIHPLHGGLTNFTVRATFTPPAQFTGSKSQLLSSVVLKYAPPFLAADPSQPMSVRRQVVEAQALSLLSGGPGSIATISEVLSRFPTIRIPELIHHDTEKNVLWMTDLGDTLTLSDYLASNPPSSTIEQVSAHLGEFFSDFFSATRDPSDDILPPVTHTEETYSFLSSVTKKVLEKAGNKDAEQLAERVSEGLNSNGSVEPCLGMVDLWPGSILIDSRGDCGLVDWEYFGRSTASSELGMLVAHLHIILLKTQTSAHHDATRSFTTCFLESYFKRSAAPSLYFKRQFLLAYGRELVNGVEFLVSELDEPSKQRLLHLGIRSLTAAGDSENELDYSAFEDPDDEFNALNKHIISMQ